METTNKTGVLDLYQSTPEHELPDLYLKHRAQRLCILVGVPLVVGILGAGVALLLVLAFPSERGWGWGQPLIFVGLPLACVSLVLAWLLTRPAPNSYLPAQAKLVADLEEYRKVHHIEMVPQATPVSAPRTRSAYRGTAAIAVSVVFALFNVGCIVWVGTFPMDHAEIVFTRLFFGLICGLFLAAIVAFAHGRYKGGTTFMIAGGVLNIPLGFVAIGVAIYTRGRGGQIEWEATELQKTKRTEGDILSDQVCPGCGLRLRKMQVETMVGNARYNLWCRSGYCSSRCYEEATRGQPEKGGPKADMTSGNATTDASLSEAPAAPAETVRVMLEDGRIKELKAPQTASDLAEFLGDVLKS